jgi:hypothetical protein
MKMKTKDKIREIIKNQGWTEEMVGVLSQEFIIEQRLSSKFLAFLKEIAAEKLVPPWRPSLKGKQ